MCLTTEALMLFLSMLPQDRIEVGADRIVVHADVRDAVWTITEERWCTRAPQIDAAFRLGTGTDA